VAAAHRTSGGTVSFQRIAAQRRCFYSTFMASLIDPYCWRQFGGLALSDISNDPLPLMAAVPARTIDYPDIIIIQHESIFDPRIFGPFLNYECYCGKYKGKQNKGQKCERCEVLITEKNVQR